MPPTTTPPDAMAFPPSPIEPPVDDAALEGRLAEEVASLGVPRAGMRVWPCRSSGR